jgi:pilus assembly protein Flp/PilA
LPQIGAAPSHAAGVGDRSYSGVEFMIRFLESFLTDESGATAIEYALIASLIAVFIIGALSVLGTSLSSEFGEVSGALK